tara:strand:- start:208825 stop:209499 length:675 start_codon:yes stop_codon:yes gene_type:complete
MTSRTFVQHAFFQSLTVLALASIFCQTASAQVGKQRGATLGGLAGAVAGGLIGDNNGEAGAGAVIGGLVGAVTGGVLGDAADKENAIRNQQYYYQQQQQQIAQVQSAVTINDVVNMSRSGLSDQVILNQVHQRGFAQQLRVPDIIGLHQQGVSESVISALQSAPAAGQTVARPIVTPVQPPVVYEHVTTPIIVREHHVVPHYAPPHHYYRSRHHRPSSSFHLRF